MINDALREAIAAHALSVYPAECCGLVVAGEYRPLRNTHEKPTEAFRIAPEDWAECEDAGPVEALVHSHPGASARPSPADLDACEAGNAPLWVIVSLGAQADGSIGIEYWHEFGPSGYVAPLEGLEFVHGSHDCYGAIQRWYARERGLSLPYFERADAWWDDGVSDLYRAGFPAAGFVSVGLSAEYRVGDVLLMRVPRCRNGVPNHAAVYVGNDNIFHHMAGRLSRIEGLPRYREYVCDVLRHKEFLV